MGVNMANDQISLERFIPVNKQEIINDLCDAAHWSEEERKLFKGFCRILVALYHYKFHHDLEQIKAAYVPFIPDADTVTQCQYDEITCEQLQKQLIQSMEKLLNDANYDKLTVEKINQGVSEISPHGLSTYVDLEDFSEILAYYRGSTSTTLVQRDWKTLFIKKKTIEIPIYKRLVILLKFKSLPERVKELCAQNLKLTEKQATKKIQKSRQAFESQAIDGYIFIKLFKDLPHADLEVLFPNRQVKFKLFDKIKLAITGGGGTIAGIVTTITKVASALNPFTILAAFIGLIAVIFRQIKNFFYQRNHYMMKMAQNLYFHNLANNLAVIGRLIDTAEEEECKEAILAYYFLYSNPEKNYTQTDLDQEIEQYLKTKYGVYVDFEIADSLRKLQEESLLEVTQEGVLKVTRLTSACKKLDEQWDCFFDYS